MNKTGKTTYWLSAFFALVVLTSSIYVFMPDKVKLVVENTNSKFFVWEAEKWVLAATEYVNIFDGTTKMRASSREVVHQTDGNITTIIRTSKWKENITTIDTYTFDSTLDDVTLFPIKHTIQILNANGKILHIEYRDILYDGDTSDISSPFSFGHNMKLEWESGEYRAKVYQQSVASDKIIIRYKINSDNFTKSVRVFDPPIKEIIVTELYNSSIIYYNITEEVYVNCTLYNYNYSDCTHHNMNGSCDGWNKIYYNTTCDNGTSLVEKNRTTITQIGFNIILKGKDEYNITGECCGYFNETEQIICKQKIAGVCNPICQQSSNDITVYDEYCYFYDLYDNKIESYIVGEYPYVIKNKIKLSKIKVKI